VRSGDADALVAFYNGLSARSKRLFRPLGEVTTLEACRGVVRDNLEGSKLDLVAPKGGVIVGWGFVWGLMEEEPTFGLCVADAHQRQGLGSVLIDRVLAAVRARGLTRVHLTVVQDNLVAFSLYESRGFVRYGELVGSDGLPYYQMALDLGEELPAL
jgi:ribosomal protein S18 acetylase RimI-like enzyme